MVDLWTAHLILEYGQPILSLKEECLKVIKRYTDNSISAEIGIEEKLWLDNYMATK